MHLQRQGDEHSGSGNRGASSLKKRLRRSPSIAGHAMAPATTLTACHGCLIGPGSFVFVTIRRLSFTVRHYDPESGTVSSGSATHSGASLFGLLTRVLTVYARVSAGYGLRSASAC